MRETAVRVSGKLRISITKSARNFAKNAHNQQTPPTANTIFFAHRWGNATQLSLARGALFSDLNHYQEEERAAVTGRFSSAARANSGKYIKEGEPWKKGYLDILILELIFLFSRYYFQL